MFVCAACDNASTTAGEAAAHAQTHAGGFVTTATASVEDSQSAPAPKRAKGA